MKNCSIDTVLSLSSICFFAFCISLTSSLNSDALSLLALKAATLEDPKHALVSWSYSDSSPCKWGGIVCDDANHRVTSISLCGKNLNGYIPSEIGALSFLTSLDLSQNSFSGPLPHQITNLHNLVHLDLSSNNLSGSLPQGLSSLAHLRGTLNLSYNAFSDEIPASFGRFPVMVSLDLRHNNLTGKIPQVESLLNQGPTAFSGNPFLCGFPSNTLCAEVEARNPRFSDRTRNGVAGNGKTKSGMVTVCVICGVSVAVMGMVFVSVWLTKRKWKVESKMGRENVGMEMGGREKGEKGRFVVVDEGFGLELEDLLRASAYVLGKSRSGIVYKVVVSGPAGGGPSVVAAAVRRLSEGEPTPWRFKEFEAEAEAIAKVQHPNIVRLKAYYYASDEKLLISDYIGNGSLHNALHGNMNSLSWAARIKIAQEVARGLMHIHECSSSHRKLVHGDIKTSKILLDDDLKPYISGFGLSRFTLGASRSSNAASRRQNPSHAPISSISSTKDVYVAPEARGAGSRFTQKCDVYSFGIVLLELLTGRLPGGGPESEGKGVEGVVRKVFREESPLSEIVDPALLQEVRAKKQVVAMFHIALSCTELDPEMRPKMRMVCDNLDCIKLD